MGRGSEGVHLQRPPLPLLQSCPWLRGGGAGTASAFNPLPPLIQPCPSSTLVFREPTHKEKNTTGLTGLVDRTHYQLNQVQSAFRADQVTDTSIMVMVSYNSNEKQAARQIYATLKVSGINAWTDCYNFPQTINKTAEDSTVIVVFYSQSYQNSSNCEHEALYSLQLNKKQVFALVQRRFFASRLARVYSSRTPKLQLLWRNRVRF